MQSAFENSPERQGETGVYRRADVEGFATWARSTIDRLQRELADALGRVGAAEQRAAAAEHLASAAEQRAAAAGRMLTDRQELEELLVKAADQAADAAAMAAVSRVEALLDEARAKVGAAREPERREPPAPALFDQEPDPVFAREPEVQSAPATFDDPVRDPLPPWDERLLAFPDEQSELPPIGPIFEGDNHRTA